jgi:hypothetical protein
MACIEIMSSLSMAHLNRQSSSVRHRQVFLELDGVVVKKPYCYMPPGANGDPYIENVGGVLHQQQRELG